MVLVLVIGLGLIVGGIAYLGQTAAQSRYQDRLRNTVAIHNEIKASDPNLNRELTSLHVALRNGQFGFIPQGMVEPYLVISVSAEPVTGGASAMVVYFNYQDEYAANCTRLQAGMSDNGTGLHVGTIRDLGLPGVIRCSTMENGKTRGEIRIPYSKENTYLATKRGGGP